MNQTDVPASARSDLDRWRSNAAANSFDADPFFRRVLQRHLGARFSLLEERFRQVAEAAGPELGALVAESSRDENLPQLRRHDPDGRPLEDVVFHPSYHVVGQVFWSSGVLSLLSEPGNVVASGGLSYLLDQHGEAGHSCPVACTAGAIRLLQQVGTDDQKRRYLPSLLDADYRQRLHAAQFVTEVQGGSDVGLNAAMARPDPDRPGWFRISGEKWFCSVADAGLFVVSARLEGAPEGTKGLGLFLVPRLMEGRPNGFVLRRLKSKLGTRSMATGEVEFEGALGEAIGLPGDGFRNLVAIVLDTSRIHNAIAACSIMHRASVEAHHYAVNRTAFSSPIIEFPAVQSTLAEMRARTMAGLASTFRILTMTDLLDRGPEDESLAGARRISVMINKYWTAIAATRSARDGIEVLGGNGTIEDFSPMPRLYRDAMVVESWEGTHNTLVAQVLRDFAVRRLHRPWLDLIRDEIESLAHPAVDGARAFAGKLCDGVERRIARLLEEPAQAPAQIRTVVDHMCRLTDWVSLAAQARWDLENGASDEVLSALEFYRLVNFERADPQTHPELIELCRSLSAAP